MEIAAIVRFVLVLTACNAHAICSSIHGDGTDRLSLLEFKKAINLDPQQALTSWNDSTHFCHWEGVLCSMKTPHRVTSLNLTSRGLVGQISPSLGNLTFLKSLSLADNSFTGEIPQTLTQMHRLQTLCLSNNTLGGKIPNLANFSILKVLWLNGNNLVGQIPSSLPHHLEDLHISTNNLTGAIPASLANLTKLIRFSCAFNNIEGNIPNQIAKLNKMQILHMGSNKLVGSFPQAILNLTTLVQLKISYNHLSGEVPSSLGNSLPNLQLVVLGSNFFHGHVPCSLTNASNVYHIDISNNNFTGMLPTSVGKLPKLTWFNVELNNLHGPNNQDWEFMNNLANCSELQIFSIYSNRLEGHVPNTFGNHSTKLQHVYMGLNQLSGGFPSGIENHPNLISLQLRDNRFTGALPNWLGTLKSLQKLSLIHNTFTGALPSSLYNLSNLALLYLGSNQFNGHIDPSLGNLQMLIELDISNNNLNDSVPREIFKIPSIVQIDLSYNSLSGQLPIDVGKARQLTYLNLSSNKLSGNIPNALGNCESLEHIMLDRNIFNGSIPNSIGNIHSLKVLNMSHNYLAGTIPPSLGDLKLLDQLDVSFNHLKGQVPTKGIFMNATATQINGNQALCGGTLELHLLACFDMSLDSTKQKQYSIVLKVVIPLASVVLITIVISILFFWRGISKRKSISLPSFDIKFPKVSYNDLARATSGFSTSKLIGRGRYSFVYQGNLFQDRIDVAVKVFDLETRGAHECFIAECNALRNVRHRNIVPILTTCSSIDPKGNDFKALVYEFMQHGDLYALLYSTRDCDSYSVSNQLTLDQRLGIASDVANALEYLHHNNQGTIIHCDLKPSNILLDGGMTACVGDFGLAIYNVSCTKPTPRGDSNSTYEAPNPNSSLNIKGTIGYIAPEWAVGAQASTAVDVYSFGVVLLEIFIRRRPTDGMFTEGLSIAKFVEMNLPDKVMSIVDPQLVQELDLCQETPMGANEIGVLLSVLSIGLCCTKLSASERMNMQEVASKLHEIRAAYINGCKSTGHGM